MNKLVILSLGKGNLQNGFDAVTAQIGEDGDPYLMKFTGSLPPAPEISQLYRDWQLLYSAVYQRLDFCPRLEIENAGVTNVSEVEFQDLCQRLAMRINAWLNCEQFRNIEQQLRTRLHPNESIRFIIEADKILWHLPWHLWQFFEDYPKAEVAFSTCEYKTPQKSLTKTPGTKVRILAILGHSQGIDIGKDRAFLEQLSHKAEIKFLVEPHLDKLYDQLWKQGWDIMFFAGHSYSKEKGIIQLNSTQAIALDKLSNALKKAISRGLKLVIFNSCDGIGLAQDLANLQIPQAIAMREPVPDAIAQEFLRHFLEAFSSGQSLYTAVREARQRLQKREDKYPCASWLPVICQNPAQMPTTWQEWRTSKVCPRTLLVLSMVVTAALAGVREMGMLQKPELYAFDRMLQLRPDEGPDPRLLLINVTEKDIHNQNSQERRAASLSDRTLAQLLKKLQLYQPQVIGLDIYRDFPVDSKADLKTYIQDDRLIAICEVGGSDEHLGIKPPPEIPENRLSFSDFPVDSDGIIRRQLLGMAKDSICTADKSFSFKVASTYLAAKGMQSRRASEKELQIGNVFFKKLEPHAGGYHQVDELGYQVLLNYRSSPTVAQQVTLSSVLNHSLDDKLPYLVKDRIVLIGTTAKSFKDYFPTPCCTSKQSQKLPGVIIHAHMVSQILSAVLDRRPLLWWWPAWVEIIWIWSWSFVGGMIIWYLRSPLRLVVAGGGVIVILYGLCFAFLLQGGWVPFVPAVLALVVTGGSLIAYSIFQTRQVY